MLDLNPASADRSDSHFSKSLSPPGTLGAAVEDTTASSSMSQQYAARSQTTRTQVTFGCDDEFVVRRVGSPGHDPRASAWLAAGNARAEFRGRRYRGFF